MNLNERISPKTFLKTYIYEPTPLVSKKKKRPKISMDNFEVPKITEYNNIIEIKGSCDTCSICYENKVEKCFIKCGHACICGDCFTKL